MNFAMTIVILILNYVMKGKDNRNNTIYVKLKIRKAIEIEFEKI